MEVEENKHQKNVVVASRLAIRKHHYARRALNSTFNLIMRLLRIKLYEGANKMPSHFITVHAYNNNSMVCAFYYGERRDSRI